ncbi:hypothetical protein ASE79_15325 [Sphingomonas sp. Leaf28]|nr:hypothetical protein ASE79_15325 [Sphingomonas sp. Leaf28]
MLAELADGRMQEIKQLLLSLHEEDAAFRAVQVCRQIDTECIMSDEDEVGHEAWLARSHAAEHRLAWIPARTGKGLAAKLRYALEMNGTDLGDKLVEQVLGQLERWA